MNDITATKNRIIARILAVNDLCQDKAHARAMRAVVMAAVNEGFNEILDHQAQQGAGARTDKLAPEGV